MVYAQCNIGRLGGNQFLNFVFLHFLQADFLQDALYQIFIIRDIGRGDFS